MHSEQIDDNARFTCRVPSADAPHAVAAETHGLTDTLDRVVAADEREF
jgi:hypothetical protein